MTVPSPPGDDDADVSGREPRRLGELLEVARQNAQAWRPDAFEVTISDVYGPANNGSTADVWEPDDMSPSYNEPPAAGPGPSKPSYRETGSVRWLVTCALLGLLTIALVGGYLLIAIGNLDGRDVTAIVLAITGLLGLACSFYFKGDG